MLNTLLYVLLGLAAGAYGGMLGLGGGTIIVPALIYIFKMSQHQAQGTALAMMIPPIGILAAWTYYQQGNVNIKIAAFLCAGFIIGAMLGAKVANAFPAELLRRIFGVALLVIALRMVFCK